MAFNKKPLSFEEVLTKMMRYCSFQERSEFDINRKLYDFSLDAEKRIALIERLKADNFLNEKRFAKTFVKGKINSKRWGVYKIKEGLVAKGIDSEIIIKSLNEIDQKKYLENFCYLSDKKIDSLSKSFEDKGKLYRYLKSKGYEGSLISKKMEEYF